MAKGGKREGAGRKVSDNPRKLRAIKFTDKEWETVQQKANKIGITKSEYIRKKTLE